jgi:hypothetical protein
VDVNVDETGHDEMTGEIEVRVASRGTSRTDPMSRSFRRRWQACRGRECDREAMSAPEKKNHAGSEGGDPADPFNYQ